MSPAKAPKVDLLYLASLDDRPELVLKARIQALRAAMDLKGADTDVETVTWVAAKFEQWLLRNEE